VPVIVQQHAWPNPQHGVNWGLAVDLSAPADGIEFKVYTESLVLAGRADLSGSFRVGWNPASFILPGLPAGLYYVRAQARSHGQPGPWARPVKLMRLP
jgi:hypothetical protein